MRKHISTHLLTLFGCCMMLLSGCDDASHFKVNGVVAGAEGQIMYLENVGVSSVSVLDSVKLSVEGKFKFSENRPEYPDFYRLRLNNQLINFAVDSTETITIEADAGAFATSYSIEGSKNCKDIKAITLAQLDANQVVGRLRKSYDDKMISDTTYRKELIQAVNSYKEAARKYIFADPRSTVAYYALFQQIDGMLLFDLYDKQDVRTYGAVATNYDHMYPKSPRSLHLKNLTLQSMKVLRSQRELDFSKVKQEEVNFIDIALPDYKGENVKLSEVVPGHAVILMFTAYQAEWSPAVNMLLGDLYTAHHKDGLDIYQVSLDADVHFWKNVAANLPWNCVRDPESVYSQIAGTYNVKQLPTIFLIDRKGNLCKRVEDLKNLASDVKSVL